MIFLTKHWAEESQPVTSPKSLARGTTASHSPITPFTLTPRQWSREDPGPLDPPPIHPAPASTRPISFKHLHLYRIGTPHHQTYPTPEQPPNSLIHSGSVSTISIPHSRNPCPGPRGTGPHPSIPAPCSYQTTQRRSSYHRLCHGQFPCRACGPPS
jgi:hypothetical protein